MLITLNRTLALPSPLAASNHVRRSISQKKVVYTPSKLLFESTLWPFGPVAAPSGYSEASHLPPISMIFFGARNRLLRAGSIFPIFLFARISLYSHTKMLVKQMLLATNLQVIQSSIILPYELFSTQSFIRIDYIKNTQYALKMK